jgi:hypothetical protein
VRDTVELEWAGIPSVAIVHKAMSGSARAIAMVSGMPDYRFITVDYPHVPLAVWTPDEIREVAAEVAPQVIACLTHDRTTDQNGLTAALARESAP